MKIKTVTHTLFFLIFIIQFNSYSQEKELNVVDPQKLYSTFTDFRIPVEENLNEVELLQKGWKTKAGHYRFRCNKEQKRVRLTLWTLESHPKVDGSDTKLVNVTHEAEKCDKKDLTLESKVHIQNLDEMRYLSEMQ